ncbi:MAG: hypothetical protein NUW22_04840 [Acidobacteria bacterium]|nr:hypothetical protein [Acidobacteriota bacterium]
MQLRRLRHGHFSAVDLDDSIAGPIVLLGFLRRPSAVLFAVVAIVVDAVKAVLGAWARSYVSQEGIKRLPLLGKRDAPSSVPLKAGVSRIKTPGPHRGPDLVFGQCGAFLGGSMGRIDPDHSVVGHAASMAAATGRRAGLEITAHVRLDRAAFASAPPFSISWSTAYD